MAQSTTDATSSSTHNATAAQLMKLGMSANQGGNHQIEQFSFKQSSDEDNDAEMEDQSEKSFT